jgi:sulfatase modifying factor 1
MSLKQFATVAVFAVLGASITSAHITIPTVPIGNPGNAADSTGYGSVAYRYNIGTTEVTNAQYAAFLNAVAKTDTNSLYNTDMAGSFGGITRTGSAGSYTYATITGRANNPVNYVSFGDAARFANWLHNGQPTGAQNNSTTDDGVYRVFGIYSSSARNAGWRWAVTSENEWYKAAYYQPASQGGDSDNYWLYPTSTNIMTSAQANYFFGNSNSNTRPVGSYAANYYGVFEMGGNVSEWNESIIPNPGDVPGRCVRGGWFNGNLSHMRADTRGWGNFWLESERTGFRVAQVPGPSAVALLAAGGLGMLRRQRRS